MEDVLRIDRALFIKQLIAPARIFWTLFALLIYYQIFPMISSPVSYTIFPAILALYAASAHRESVSKRFHDQRFQAIWNGCRARLKLLQEVLDRCKKDKSMGFSELRDTVRRVADSLYYALRRADIICHEVKQTEKGFYNKPFSWMNNTADHHAQELYRIADKNIAEYRTQYASVMAGVARAEAQAAVFMTSVDSTRMKLIGYRMSGKSPELEHREFLDAINESKLQLAAIDLALEELELVSFRLGGTKPPPFLNLPPEVPQDEVKQ